MVSPRRQEQPDRQDQQDDVEIEDGAGVAGREISLCDHLADMTNGGAQKKDRVDEHGGGSKAETRAKSSAAGDAKGEIGTPTSYWKGLSAQPIKRAAISG